MRPKAKTNLEKMGFIDLDKKNPTHDEIQLWLLENTIDFLLLLKSGQEVNKEDIKGLEIKLEVPVYSDHLRKFIVGFLDAVIMFEYKGKYYKFCIEIKSNIDSFGETLRQINTYKNYVEHRSRFVIICPNDKYISAFKSQDIQLIKYEPSKS